MRFKMQASIDIQAPIDKVWAVVSGEFGEVGRWTSGLAASHPIFDPSGTQVIGRVCRPQPGSIFGSKEVEEELIEHDHRVNCFTYRANKLPRGFKKAQNRWCVHRASPNRSRLEIAPDVEATFFHGLMFRLFAASLIRKVLEELKHYIETGQPHPRKIKANRKLARLGGQ